MPDTLPNYTKAIDNAFVETWYDIKPEAVDNILLATPVWAALKEHGCFKEQRGSYQIERTLKYAVGPKVTAVQKGDTLGYGEVQTETAAFWSFRNLSTYAQRSVFDDRANAGKFRIKDYVKQRLMEAREAMEQIMEMAALMTTLSTDAPGTAPANQTANMTETGKSLQTLIDMIPPGGAFTDANGTACNLTAGTLGVSVANTAPGTYGGVARAANSIMLPNGCVVGDLNQPNGWNMPKYKQLVAPIEVNLISDMKVLYNTVHANQVPPNLLISDQSFYELYEEFAVDKTQLIKDETSRLADLGFEVLRFKGKPFVWTPNMPAFNCLFVNMDFVDVVYDPGLWFDMTEWKAIPLQGERIAHFLSSLNIISTQLRRHGRLFK